MRTPQLSQLLFEAPRQPASLGVDLATCLFSTHWIASPLPMPKGIFMSAVGRSICIARKLMDARMRFSDEQHASVAFRLAHMAF